MSGKASAYQRRCEAAIFKKLLDRIDELDDENQVGRRYQEFMVNEFIRLSDQAVLVDMKGQEVWIPFSQIRKFDDDLYVTAWILEQKGLL